AESWKQVFTRKQVRERLKRSDSTIQRRLDSGKFTAPHRGLYVRALGVDDFLTTLIAAFVWLDAKGVVSGAAAGWLHRLDGCDAPLPELVVPRTMRNRNGGSVLIRSSNDLAPHHVTRVAGLKCMTPARAIVNLCEIGAPRNQIVMAYEDNYRRGWRARQELGRCVEELKNSRDLSILKELISRRGGKAKPTESALEAVADDILWRAGIRGQRQVTIRDEATGLWVRFDLAFIELRYGFEYDGARWHLLRARFRKDRVDDRLLQTIKWGNARWTWADVLDELRFISTARALLDVRREAVLGTPIPWMPEHQIVFPF
ncbi:MAG: hypothetical protein ACJ790_10470, partial [Myxococcaceae bacterium]